MDVMTTDNGRTRLILTDDDARRVFSRPAQEGINGGRPTTYRVEHITIHGDGDVWVWAIQLTKSGAPYKSGMGLTLGGFNRLAEDYGQAVADVVTEAVAAHQAPAAASDEASVAASAPAPSPELARKLADLLPLVADHRDRAERLAHEENDRRAGDDFDNLTSAQAELVAIQNEDVERAAADVPAVLPPVPSPGFTDDELAAQDVARRAHYRMDYPVPSGRPVLQGHADACAEYGHGTWTENGTDKGVCPRCGELTAPAANFPAPLKVGTPVSFTHKGETRSGTLRGADVSTIGRLMVTESATGERFSVAMDHVWTMPTTTPAPALVSAVKWTRVRPGEYTSNTGWTVSRTSATAPGSKGGRREVAASVYPTPSTPPERGTSSLPGYALCNSITEAKAYAVAQGDAASILSAAHSTEERDVSNGTGVMDVASHPAHRPTGAIRASLGAAVDAATAEIRNRTGRGAAPSPALTPAHARPIGKRHPSAHPAPVHVADAQVPAAVANFEAMARNLPEGSKGRAFWILRAHNLKRSGYIG